LVEIVTLNVYAKKLNIFKHFAKKSKNFFFANTQYINFRLILFKIPKQFEMYPRVDDVHPKFLMLIACSWYLASLTVYGRSVNSPGFNFSGIF
jgi:hypothetical protein